MSRLDIMTPSHAQTVIDGLYRDVERRIAASPPGLCPVDLAKSFLDLCHAQTCGKCVPCRIGLGQLSELMEQVLEGEATMETISIIERVARVIVNSADCAIGRDAARLVLDGVQGFRDDYEEHILRHRCLGGMREPVPCVALCPAGVDIPGYLVLIKYGRYADAVRLTFSVRSSVNREKFGLIDQLKALAARFGGSYSESGEYPAWEYQKDSRLREVMVEVFEAQYGRKPVVEAIHAGLECGIFSDRLPGLDAVSFGPQMHDIHTSREKLDIASTARTWEYLVAVLERL